MCAGDVRSERFSRPGAVITAEANTVDGQPSTRPTGFSDIVARVKPAVIGVRAQAQEQALEGDGDNDDQDSGDNRDSPGPRHSPFYEFFHRGQPEEGAPHSRLTTALGSGFCISADGYAVTNNHVVENGKKLAINTDDGKTYQARLVGTDRRTDVALIKVDGRSDFPFVKFADGFPRVGDWVLAVGKPFGLGGTVTAGIVSARGRQIGMSGYDDFIQIDAPVNQGNSGGPTFDVDGRVIGVNTAIFSPSGGFVGIAFDIPADVVKLIVQQLRDKGAVTRGWIGVQIQPMTPEIADSLELNNSEGVLVAETQSGGPAAVAGIESGDVIDTVDGTSVRDTHDLAKRIAALPPKSSSDIGIRRGAEQKTIKVIVGELPDATNGAVAEDSRPRVTPHRPAEGLGLTVASARVAGVGDDGVVVTQVDPSGKAADTDIRTGDVITAIGGEAVNNADDVNRALANAREKSKRSVLLRVKSSGQVRFVAIPVG